MLAWIELYFDIYFPGIPYQVEDRNKPSTYIFNNG